MNRNMYIRSGEWVIISRGKFTVRLKDNIFKNLRFRVFLVVMLAGLIPGSAALLGIVKVYETRAVDFADAGCCIVLCDEYGNVTYEIYKCNGRRIRWPL